MDMGTRVPRQEVIIRPTRTNFWRSPSLAAIALALPLVTSSAMGDDCTEVVAEVVSIQGRSSLAGSPLAPAQSICAAQLLAVGSDSRVAIRLTNTQTVVRLDQNSTLSIENTTGANSLLNLLKGVLHLFSRRPESLEINTPYINAAVEGTEFVVRSSDSGAEVIVIEGQVLAGNAFGEILLRENETAVARADEAPVRRVVVDSGNAVRWALYYPPVSQTEQTTDAFRRAADLLAVGDVTQALAILKDGNVDAVSLGLRAMIAVAQNRNEEALELATQSVQLDASSSIAHTALSYAQQASFEIESALRSAETAVGNNPEDPYALARLAELQLGVDRVQAALESAQAALRVGPTVSRAETVLGFVHLVRLDMDRAGRAFENAIKLDQSDPLPRLGLGLAVIRGGNLAVGREHIEEAASLDPNNAMIRSYLGKAYFEEHYLAEATAQLKLAKRLDRRDPTPWLYDAILLQSQNQPVEAFESLTTATSLNENTLVYRSRSLVDKSAAAGSMGLASIYTDLGFQQLAINEGSRSVARDPTNFAANRFLADTFAERERHESARRSILFRSTLLQPMTINPVQPEARESDLRIVPGASPSDPSINEYTPLFDGDGLQLSGSLSGGNRGTFGDQLVLSGLGNRAAFSLGQFHYETDGFRDNADVEHDLYSALIQVQPLANAYVQAEYHKRRSEQGDLALNFDPDAFDPNLRELSDTESPRIGIRLQPQEQSTLLFTAQGIDVNETSQRPFATPGVSLNSLTTADGYNTIGQFIHQGPTVSHSFGLEYVDLDVGLTVGLDPCDEEPCVFADSTGDASTSSVYYYANSARSDSLNWTVGLNYSRIDDDPFQIDEDSFGPRLGLQWDVSQSLLLRFSIARGIKRRKAAELTLEPVVLAGFNQLYDDVAGTLFLNNAIGLDWEITSSSRVGVSVEGRDLDVPHLVQFTSDEPGLVKVKEQQSETTLRGYWYQILGKRLSMSAELLYETNERDNLLTPDGSPALPAPVRMDSLTIPVGFSYFRPSGLFLQSTVSFVHQSLDVLPVTGGVAAEDSVFNEDSEEFFYTDLSVGYRVPRLRGLFQLDVNNLFDESFLYQDHNVVAGSQSNPRFSPGRAFYARMSFNF